jgi:hypothetical protein
MRSAVLLFGCMTYNFPATVETAILTQTYLQLSFIAEIFCSYKQLQRRSRIRRKRHDIFYVCDAECLGIYLLTYRTNLPFTIP